MSIPSANIKNLRFSLRYPPDKIVAIYEGSFTATGSSSPPFSARRTHETIAHSFGETVFVNLTYSLDGGTTWQDQNISIPDLSSPTMPVFQTLAVSAYSTTTDIVIVASKFTAGNATVTYKVVASWKD